jgi:predicted Rossmann fold flavoprotein
VIGAGAAGLFTALFAARSGARALVLETRPRPGAKIRVSGGGRCNVLPSAVTLDDFHTSGSKHAMRNVLFSWPLPEVRRFFEDDLRVPLKTEPTGKVFPRSDSSKEIVDALLAACEGAGVVLQAGFRVNELRRAQSGAGGEHGQGASAPRFEVLSDDGRLVRARRVVIATGGLSLPKTGSEGAGYRFARSLGHTVRPTSAALVSLETPDSAWGELAGISCLVDARARAGNKTLERRRGELLVTHDGFSGPVVLDLSRWFTTPRSNDEDAPMLEVAWGGIDVDRWESTLRAGGSGGIEATVREHLPRRLADHLVARARVDPEARRATLPREERARLVRELGACALPISGHGGYAKAEVTQGGVPLEEVRLETLESRIVPGLHFVGEVLDVTGRLGGYNFLWAWVTGRKAGLAIASSRE